MHYAGDTAFVFASYRDHGAPVTGGHDCIGKKIAIGREHLRHAVLYPVFKGSDLYTAFS